MLSPTYIRQSQERTALAYRIHMLALATNTNTRTTSGKSGEASIGLVHLAVHGGNIVTLAGEVRQTGADDWLVGTCFSNCCFVARLFGGERAATRMHQPYDWASGVEWHRKQQVPLVWRSFRVSVPSRKHLSQC